MRVFILLVFHEKLFETVFVFRWKRKMISTYLWTSTFQMRREVVEVRVATHHHDRFEADWKEYPSHHSNPEAASFIWRYERLKAVSTVEYVLHRSYFFNTFVVASVCQFARVNANWPSYVAGWSWHSSGPIDVNHGELALLYGTSSLIFEAKKLETWVFFWNPQEVCKFEVNFWENIAIFVENLYTMTFLYTLHNFTSILGLCLAVMLKVKIIWKSLLPVKIVDSTIVS